MQLRTLFVAKKRVQCLKRQVNKTNFCNNNKMKGLPQPKTLSHIII